MARSHPLTAVEAARAQRRWITVPLAILLAVALVIGMGVLLIGLTLLVRYSGESTAHDASDSEHFKYGSIGSERTSGIPYRVWQALPALYPATFSPALEAGQGPYSVFGFLYETGRSGEPAALPIGISKRTVRGIDLVWLNCAVCHAGSWSVGVSADASRTARREIVVGMPSNNLDLHRFIVFLQEIADDETLAPDVLLPTLEATSGKLGPFERLLWRYLVIPELREGLLSQRARLGPLLAEQPAWGPGRVDTFNPYKVIELGWSISELAPAERIGTADLPSIFHQRPREGMHLHWDGNNPSLAERNLSAAVGAGLDLASATAADHRSIERVAAWLGDLVPPPSPLTRLVDRPGEQLGAQAMAAQGRALYMEHCASCHGYQDSAGYVFEGERLGLVEPIVHLGTDPARLDSYTERFREAQRTQLGFEHFIKTDGYANHPLDGLWLRGPYLHNGAVPTLYDLLQPPEQRPIAFLRGSDVLDAEKIGFASAPCEPSAETPPGLFCFDTRQAGNGNGGHDYGTRVLTEEQKAALLAYLRTF